MSTLAEITTLDVLEADAGVKRGPRALTAEERHALVTGSSFREQFVALHWQRWVLAARNWRSTAAQVLIGVVVVALLVGFQAVADSVLGNAELHVAPSAVGPLPSCIPGGGGLRANADGSLSPGCNTVLFAPSSPAVTALLRRVAEPREIAEAIVFAASPAASFATGSVWTLDGGVTAGKRG